MTMNQLTIQLIKKLCGVNIEQLQADNEQLLVKNGQLSTEIKQASQEVAYKRLQLTDMQKDLSAVQAELEKLQNAMNQAKEEVETARTEKEKACSEREAAIAEAKTANERAEQAEEAATIARSEAAKAIAEKEEAMTRVEEAITQAEEAKAETEAAKTETEAAKAETKTAKVKAEQALAQMEEAVAQAKNANERAEQAEAAATTARSEAAKAIAEKEEAVTRAEEAIAQAEAAKAETEAAKAEAETAKAEVAKASTEAEEAVAKAEKAEAEARKETEELRKINDQLTLEASRLATQNEQQAETIHALQEQLQEWEQRCHALATAPPEEPAPTVVTPTPEEPTTDEPSEATSAQGDIVEAYQEMKEKLAESTHKHPYTRITTLTDGSQHLYLSKTLGLKAELFVWGVEGKDIVLDEPYFIPYNDIACIEGLDTPFATEPMACDFSEEGNATEVAETLLTAICRYQPVRVTYRDKNGRISDRNLYWISFLPGDRQIIRLPNPHLFEDMFEDNIDTDHLLAMCAHHAEPRIFIINQIQALQVFDVFTTNERGIQAQLDGYRAAVECGQEEAAEMIAFCLPEQFRKQLEQE